MSQPIAIISGDIHYSLSNLELADKATRMAIDKANELNVPFVANGDTTDTKANLRAECVNAMLKTFRRCKVTPYINIGNHCKINSRGLDNALNFLGGIATIVAIPAFSHPLQSYIIPYHDNVEELRTYLKTLPKGSRLIMHQGVNGTNMGEYVTDASALNPGDLKDFRTILSHYHQRQNIKCGPLKPNNVGLATYIGSPYTITYSEHNDPPKGFQILMSDGSLEFVPTNLRRHIILNVEYVSYSGHWQITGKVPIEDIRDQDLVWVKMTGTKEHLGHYDKKSVAKLIGLSENFRLDLIPTENEEFKASEKQLTNSELLDSIVEASIQTSEEGKIRIKSLWRGMA